MNAPNPSPTQPPAAVPEALPNHEQICDLLQIGNPSDEECRLIRLGYGAATHAAAPAHTQAEPPGAAAEADLAFSTVRYILGMPGAKGTPNDHMKAIIDHVAAWPLVGSEAVKSRASERACKLVAALAAPAPTTEQAAPATRDQIREVFLQHGFTVKEGQTDLKEYVYDAAYALLVRFAGHPTWTPQMMEKMQELTDGLPEIGATPGGEAPAPDAIRALIARHAEELEGNESAYFELAYHRATGWMAWITDKPLCMPPVISPNRKVLLSGQGDTPDEACRDAMSAQSQKGTA
ncbi:hypothetical protein [Acidovorax sp. Leaf160]|uniref:hypothetical protein n=1 Tax=Acidovorax sp. Leaf160 TaxID=1736280 RepID=UPI0006F51565|nr:hypothetical protein [Acidovorax sp. Leaf160]KQR62624.1 hypothetical protein ASF94_15495 [Acidovorax sp. Leaf160]